MIKNIFFVLVFLFTMHTVWGSEEQVSKVIQLAEQKHHDVWPGLDLKDSPIVLTFPNREIYAVNLKKPNPVWEKVDLQNGSAHKTTKDLWKVTKVNLHPAFDIDGENVFVFKMGNDGEESIRIMAHERFHRYQLQHFAPETNKIEGYTDHFNADNLALMQIEDELLQKFLKAKKEERLDILKDFLAINKERKQVISQASIEWEDHQQKMEGLADYVSAKMFDGEKQVLSTMGQMDEEEDFSDYAIKWRHYAAGATLAFALDFIEAKDWKEKVEKGSYLGAILEEEIAEDQSERFKKFEAKFIELKKQKAAKIKGFQDQMDNLFYQYQTIEGPILRLGHPPGLGISGGGSTERLLSLADGTTLSLKDASFSSTTDSNWKFSTMEIPFLIQHRAGYREIKIGNECCLKLNEETISINELIKGPPGEYPFETLSFVGEKFNLSSEKHRGVLICEGDHIAIRYF